MLISGILILEEIRGFFFKMVVFKVFRPDVLYAFFFKKYWDTVKGDMVDFIIKVFVTGFFPEDFNKFLICLISKVDNF